jgi:ribosomal protein L35AE/L33A
MKTVFLGYYIIKYSEKTEIMLRKIENISLKSDNILYREKKTVYKW